MREMTEPLQFRLDPGAQLPTRSYPGDAGYDLYTYAETVILPGQDRNVPTGCRIQLPPGWWAMITGRSSTLRNRKLLIAQGIIDNGYRGPLYAVAYNLSDRPVTVARGERIAQLIPIPLFPGAATEIDPIGFVDDAFYETDRGQRGYGSSGR